MPEISEVRIMSEFINSVGAKKKHFTSLFKNPEHKSKTDLSLLEFRRFRISSESRGKELQIVFSDTEKEISKIMTLTMGMSGNWRYANNLSEVQKHTHLMIKDDSGGILGLHDVRRFARWDWRDWNPDRGPDPTRQHDMFVKNIIKGIEDGKKTFNRPIYEVMMDQTFFNGVGNYLRAEILGRIGVSPFLSGFEYIDKTKEVFFQTIKKIIDESYVLGGGQFKDWYNEEDQKGQKWHSFQEWMQFYFNKEKCVPLKDRNDRVFWIDKKWINDK
jgi:endonuclease VIII-like 1